MIRIFEENTILGVSSVMVKNQLTDEVGNNEQNTSQFTDASTELKEDENFDTVETTDEVFKACMEDTGLAEEESITEQEEVTEKKHDTGIYVDYVASLNDQIEFLKGQIDEKNRQLASKDELILNFQYLLKEDRSRILLLENKLEDNKVSFWKRLFNKS